MELRKNYYKADKGKHFVLTEKGKTECASYKNKIVGEPVESDDTEASRLKVEAGFLKEVQDPDWVTMPGYRVVYDYLGHTLSAGNPIVFPAREIAEAYKENYEKFPWFKEELRIDEAVYEGKKLQKCREYEGKKIFNESWYYGIDALRVGDLIEEDVVDYLINCLPPVCMRNDCTQLGEASCHKTDKNGNCRAVYSTFRCIDEGIWEYCGDCFKGENIQREV